MELLNLSGSIFEKAELHQADLRDTDLQGAQLGQANNLSADSLAGADLTGAQLPQPIAEFDGLAAVAEVSKDIQTFSRITVSLAWIPMAAKLANNSFEMARHSP